MPGFVLLVRDRRDADPTMRIGYTVTKKIGNAVERNRMKRRLRALARVVLPDGGVAGADHVLIGRSGGIERDFNLLRTELGRALHNVVKDGLRKSAASGQRAGAARGDASGFAARRREQEPLAPKSR